MMSVGGGAGRRWNAGRFARTVAIFVVAGPLIGLAVAVAWTLVADAGQMLEPVRSAGWKTPSAADAAAGLLLIGGAFVIGAMLFGAVPALAAGLVAAALRERGAGRWTICLASPTIGALAAWVIHRSGEFALIAPVAAVVAGLVCALAATRRAGSEIREA